MLFQNHSHASCYQHNTQNFGRANPFLRIQEVFFKALQASAQISAHAQEGCEMAEK
jgi:hypothetical protein